MIDKLCEEAEKIFFSISGIGKEGLKNERMREDAFAIRDELADKLDPTSIYNYYDDVSLEKDVLSVFGGDGSVLVVFRCTAFCQIDPASIEGMFVYCVSAGDHYFENRKIMDQLYADMWGTAFADAARNMIVDDIRMGCAEEGYDISDSFGPGFYGMDASEMLKLPLLIDFDRSGIKLTASGVLLPPKSCAGILFKVNDRYRHLNSSCEHCEARNKNCIMCSK